MTTKSENIAAPAAYTIAEFCSAHRISRNTLYRLEAQGNAPTMMHVGRRVLISVEAAEAWRRKCEGAAA